MAKARGGVWFPEEDTALCMAYVNIGEDGDRGTGQDSATLWRRIAEVYANLKPPNGVERPGGSCEARWRRIRPACNRWRNALTRAKAAMSSGQNSTDLELQAKSIYRTMSAGKEFNLSHCWDILQDTVKFAEPITLPEARPMESCSRDGEGSSTQADPTVPQGHVRPKGKKAQKEAKKARSEEDRSEEASRLLATQMQRSNDLLQQEQERHARYAEQLQHERDMVLITKDISHYPPASRELWELEIAEAMERIQARRRRRTTSDGSSQEPTPEFPPDWSDGYFPSID